jgi:hypothetical protein
MSGDAEHIKCCGAVAAIIPGEDGGFTPCPELMTEGELIRFLRIPDISKATDYHNVIDHLKRFYDLPCIHICGQPVYPLEAIREWIREKLATEDKNVMGNSNRRGKITAGSVLPTRSAERRLT